MKQEEYLGLTKKEAQNRAEGRNMIFRLVSVDGERYLGDPSDPGRADRVCVTIVAGKVSSVDFS